MHDIATLQKLLDPLLPGLMGLRLIEGGGGTVWSPR